MSKEFWDTRYSTDEYAYGIEPNKYFKTFIDQHPPGLLLLPGEGEGRNAVYAAGKGWRVDAVDQSQEGVKKGQQLAARFHVDIHFTIADLEHLKIKDEHYDLVALIFVHFQPETRKRIHEVLIRSLKPGGYFLMDAFSKDQLGKSSGGPQNPALLYDRDMVINDFNSLKIQELTESEEELQEGPFHSGVASLIRMIAQKY